MLTDLNTSRSTAVCSLGNTGGDVRSMRILSFEIHELYRLLVLTVLYSKKKRRGERGGMSRTSKKKRLATVAEEGEADVLRLSLKDRL